MLSERELQISPTVQESVVHNTKVSFPQHSIGLPVFSIVAVALVC